MTRFVERCASRRAGWSSRFECPSCRATPCGSCRSPTISIDPNVCLSVWKLTSSRPARGTARLIPSGRAVVAADPGAPRERRMKMVTKPQGRWARWRERRRQKRRSSAAFARWARAGWAVAHQACTTAATSSWERVGPVASMILEAAPPTNARLVHGGSGSPLAPDLRAQRRASSNRGSSRTAAKSSSLRASSRNRGSSSTDRRRWANVSSPVSPASVAKHA